LNAKGEYAGVSMYREYGGASTYPASYAVCTEKGAETLPCEPLLDGKPED
jgi:hypothetical protein